MESKPRILIPLPTSGDLAYNRECWPQYAESVREAGGVPVDAGLGLTARELLARLEAVDGVLLPGSPADVSPERYGHERNAECASADEPREACDAVLLRQAFATRKPILGICYGMQSLNVFLGGTLLQDLSCRPLNHAAGPQVGVAHMARVEPGSQLGKMLTREEAPIDEGGCARLPVNSSHHQAVGILGEGLRVSARASEDLVVEAIELQQSQEQFVMGVQWHPERSVATSAASQALFQSFLRAAGARRRVPGKV